MRKTLMHPRSLLRLLPAAGWYCMIYSLSNQPAAESGSLSNGLLYRLLSFLHAGFRTLSREDQTVIVEFLSFYIRKGAHMFLYFVLTGFLVFALRPFVGSAVRRGGLALALCTVLAALDEFHQTFIPGRSGEVRDVLVDLTGGLIFLAVWFVVHCVRYTLRCARAADHAEKNPGGDL